MANKRRPVIFKVLLVLVAVVAVLAAGFLWYVSDYYRAEPEALAVLNEEGVVDEGGVVALLPEGDADVGLVFYPGGKVEAEAYLPILDRLRDEGVACFLVRVPFNLAFFDIDAASRVMAAHPEVGHWYVGGHSLGGIAASQYADRNEDGVEGLVLLGSYIYGDYPPEETVTVYGSLNQDVEDKIDYTENVVEIEGGNHAQFGNYGPQAGDAEATISAEEQQEAAVAAITEFIEADLAA